ncbi:Sterile alpha motif, type 2 [Corchorus capsularis]|uniref:Sterile alpha motif, type 2 n=1 Tax=Corchorus capsularis TaxID=210143 RepID=A0A1R3H4I4_COCAP|nr:Sterile alpha motif, type 2 [Corchorus capsularis]
MDWYSWLSKTALEPSLIYEYGLAFSRNELQKEDLAYFNHEFLQSMGISVAKHRLEILKLARKEVIGESPNGLSKLILALNKTKKCFNKYVHKLVHHESNAIKPLPEPVRHRDQWRGALTMTRKCKSEKELKEKVELPVLRTRKVAKSGPLDYRAHDKLLVPPRSLKLSGPLDRKMQEKLVFSYKSPIQSSPIDVSVAQERLLLTHRSPRFSGPLNNYARPPSPKVLPGDYNKEKVNGDYGDQTLWAALFQDMKPT